ncbi:MAG: hypothetical protein ACHWZW_14555 [Spirulina sp.]
MKTFQSLATVAATCAGAVLVPALAMATPPAAIESTPPMELAQSDPSPTGSGRSCVALQEVTTGQTEVRKRIENRAFGSNNWHTDWLVPTQPNVSYFVAVVTPENTAPYWLDVHLRMPHGGSEQVFSDSADAVAGSTFIIPFASATGRQPAVVNTRLGGVNGNFYTISVAACE